MRLARGRRILDGISEPLFAAQVGQRLRMAGRGVCAESSQEAFWSPGGRAMSQITARNRLRVHRMTDSQNGAARGRACPRPSS
jgi:hypothetical protein